jgi:hypothetical protein
LLPLPAAPGERSRWNQLDVTEVAADLVSAVVAEAYAGITASSGNGPGAADRLIVP